MAGRAKATMKYRKKAATAAPATKRLQAAVKKVINRVAEKKQWNKTIDYTLGVPHNTLATWNLLDGLIQGTNTGQRIGDKVNLRRMRLSLLLHNNASSTVNDSVSFRIILFRGKYDYSSTNYPVNEVFENVAGSAPVGIITAPMDLNQITPLLDKTITIQNGYSGQKLLKPFTMYKYLNKTFNFRDDDTYGKVSNLYLGVYQINSATSPVYVTGNCSISFTDV